ncbi:Uncharacterised protein [Mycobacteroides abscessus subsp. abscessus]|nr:Uncharacterised protein [Mycobacteroides abscessus subsp. abscessus]
MTIRTTSTSVVRPIVTMRKVGVSVRSPRVAARPCRVQVDSQARV